MATVIWVHSIYGKRLAIAKEQKWLMDLGHKVYAPDLYWGTYFSDEDDGGEYMKNEGGEEEMLERLKTATKKVDRAVWAGWSIGALFAQQMAQKRAEEDQKRAKGDPERGPTGLLLMSSGLIWPVPFGVKAQVHATKGDIKKEELEGSKDNGAEIFHYEGDGHLFADELLPADHNPDAEVKWKTNVENFLKDL